MIDIAEDKQLADLCDRASRQDYVTLDTEFIRERTFFPVLALLQVSWRGQPPTLIDPLQIIDWKPFHKLLCNPDVCKVLHAGRQDVEIFYYQMERTPANIFDTQIAASMLGYGDQVGYSSLVSRVLGKQLAKGSSFTNWLRRPLTESQLDYARDDVRYLPDLYEHLVSRAEEMKRIDWIRRETEDQLDDSVFEPDPDDLWRKVKKANSLSPKNLAVLQVLARWRYETARKIDKPLRFVLSDEVLIEFAKVRQLGREGLHSRRGTQNKILDRYGDEIIDLHARARALDKDQWPVSRKHREKPPSEKSEALADLGWLLIKEIARGAELSPTHLTSKKEMAYFIDAHLKDGKPQDFDFMKGWRGQMVGQPLLDLIEGRISIAVRNHQIVWENERDQ